MAHRGRLNVLANIVGKPYSQIFREFEGNMDPRQTQGSGDVKYHLGAEGKYIPPSGEGSLWTSPWSPTRRTWKWSTPSWKAWPGPSRTSATSVNTDTR